MKSVQYICEWSREKGKYVFLEKKREREIC